MQTRDHDRSCWLRKGFLRAHEILLGRSTFAILERTGASDVGGLWDRQRRGLEALLAHAREQIPYWEKRLPVSRPGESAFEYLQRVPVLTRSEIARDREEMRWRGPGKELVHRSGGTTDDNLIFYWGRPRQSWDRAMRYRGLARLGIEPGDRVLHLWPREAPVTPHERLAVALRDVRDAIVADRVVDPRPWTSGTIGRLLEFLPRYRPRLIIAYPSWLIRIAGYLARRCGALGLPRPEAILTCGEVLFDFQRAIIQEVFQAPVYQEYGSQDAGIIAHEDRDRELRFHAEQMVVEVLRDHRPAPPGALGEVVVTHFSTERMPFIRYATGDVVRQPPSPLVEPAMTRPPVFPLPEGRTSDLLLTGRGELRAMRPVVEDLAARTGLFLFSVFQPEPGTVEFLHTAEGLGDGNARPSSAREVLRHHLGETVDVQIREGDHFRPLRSGKHRYVCGPVAMRQIAHDTASGAELNRAWPQVLAQE